MRRMTRDLTAAVIVMMLAFTIGCGGGLSTPGPDVSLKTVQRECKTLKPPQLREQAVAYRDLIRAEVTAIAELDQKIAGADLTIVTQEEIETMKTDRAKRDETRVTLVKRHSEYLDTLRKAGANIDDLRVEQVEPYIDRNSF